MPAAQRYTRFAVALHWIVAVVVFAQFALGWLMQEIAKQPPGPRAIRLSPAAGSAMPTSMLIAGTGSRTSRASLCHPGVRCRAAMRSSAWASSGWKRPI